MLPALLWLLLGAVIIGLLANWLHQHLQRKPKPSETAGLPGPPQALDPFETPPPTSSPKPAKPQYPETEKPGYWFRRLFTPFLILGSLAFLIQPVVLWVNTYLLSRTLGIVYDVTPEAVAHIKIWQLERDVTIFDAWALTVSLGQMLLAAVALHPRLNKDAPPNLASRLAAFGWLMLGVYEVWASVYRAWVGGEAFQQAALSGLVALGIVVLEAVSGALFFEFLLAPLVLAVLWTLAARVRAIAVWATETSFAPAIARPSRWRSAWQSFLEGLDQLLQPLRDLDRVLYDRLLARLLSDSKAAGRATLLLLLLIALPVSSLAQISAPTPVQPIEWYVAIDDTLSVKPEQYAAYTGEIFEQAVLANLQARDTLFLFTIDRKPEEHLDYLDLTRGRVHSAILDFYQHKVVTLKRALAPGWTDLGAPLAFAARMAAHQGDGARQALHVLVIMTDGAPTGDQTLLPATFPANVKVVFLGVLARHEPSLRALLKRAKMTDDQVEIVLFPGWQTWVSGFSARLHRTPDEILLQKLHVIRRKP